MQCHAVLGSERDLLAAEADFMEMEIDPGGGLEDHFVDEVGPHRGNSQERDDC